jgi:hypothetical protein
MKLKNGLRKSAHRYLTAPSLRVKKNGNGDLGDLDAAEKVHTCGDYTLHLVPALGVKHV